MSLTDLLTSLDEDAAAELDRARQAAADEASRITGQARAEADAARAEALAEAERRGTRAADRTVAAARADAAAQVRAAQDEALREVLERTRARLAGLRGTPASGAVLERCLTEALGALAAPAVVRVDPRDAALARELVARHGDLGLRTDLDTWGGCVVADTGGRFVDNTLEARLEAAWPASRAAVAARWAATADGGGR
ncbi:V-type ATP synthase subunit E [Trujillonella humicola]|uniref:V-type ATP synthase subunit E n=1 Tax=Trujillonella humicola TaxID=3383699 RepID=UPI003906A480